MKKLTKYELTKIEANLDSLFNLATKTEIQVGKRWYKQAYKICLDISNYYKSNTITVANVLSALSPRNKWEQNIKDTWKVFEAFKDGKKAEDIKVCTFHTNKFKAFNCIENNVLITESSLKTFNFVNNIAYLSTSHLTIDIWHLRACFDKKIKIDSASIGRIAYEQIKNLTIKKAEKLGLKGYEFQAILWLVCQRTYNN